MRKIAFLLFIGSILVSCQGKKEQFNLSGTVKGADTGMIFLQKFELDKWVNADSAMLKSGKFAFTGKTALPEMWQLALQENQVVVKVFVENADIEVTVFTDSLDKSVIRGSSTQDIYRQYVAQNDSLGSKMDDVYAQWKKAKEAGDTLGMERSDSISSLLEKEQKTQLVDFIKANSKTVVAPYLVMRNTWQFELPELEELYGAMDTSLRASQYMQFMQKRIDILKSVAIGQPAPDFTMNDSTGKPFSLSSLKGKVLLVDFWASWCGPCRAENPNVVKAYAAFNKKGFEILGCSFDSNREKWLAAVKDDRLTWYQVSDLKGWGNAAGKLYGVSSIPSNVLLDKDQKILARNLRGEELMTKLAGILGPATPEKKADRRK